MCCISDSESISIASQNIIHTEFNKFFISLSFLRKFLPFIDHGFERSTGNLIRHLFFFDIEQELEVGCGLRGVPKFSEIEATVQEGWYLVYLHTIYLAIYYG